MKNHQKGFAYIFLIIIFSLIIGGSVYLASKYQAEEILKVEERVSSKDKRERKETEIKKEEIKEEIVEKEIVKEEVPVSKVKEEEIIIPSPVVEVEPSPIFTPEFVDELKPLTINLRSIVGIICFFSDSNGGEYRNRGTGIIIDSEGVILTNRHIIKKENLEFQYCLVGLPNQYINQPLIGDLRAFNILDQLSNPFLYLAKIHNNPDISHFSEIEREVLDFVLLKIVGTYNDVFGNAINYVIPYPIEFPFHSLDDMRIPLLEEEVVSFGYEAENVQRGQGNFNTFRLQGWTGRIKEKYIGEIEFKDINIMYSSNMIVRQGQSGSPVFSRAGKLIGLIFAGGEDKQGTDFSETTYIIPVPTIKRVFDME